MTEVGSVRFCARSANKKLSPVERRPINGSTRYQQSIPRPPYVASTYTSIAATCPDSCRFKGAGCFAEDALLRKKSEVLDAAAHGKSSLEVVQEEAAAIAASFDGGRVPQDGARGGRDLRLHVGGDVGSSEGARLLAAEAHRWRIRGGGSVWTYTHWWREIPRSAWGLIAVLASVELAAEIEEARRAGYAAAVVVDHFPGDRAFRLPGSDVKIIPCPAETRDTNCAECRLCLDRDLLGLNVAIGFAVHGAGGRSESMRNRLKLPLWPGHLKQVSRPYHCSICGSTKHNRAKHEERA